MSITIVDLNGTLVCGKGKDATTRPFARQFMRSLCKKHARVIVWTCTSKRNVNKYKIVRSLQRELDIEIWTQEKCSGKFPYFLKDLTLFFNDDDEIVVYEDTPSKIVGTKRTIVKTVETFTGNGGDRVLLNLLK